ncbi:MAG: ribonuclease E/G [Henriciella sp.]|nr:ribonuclease E/G [Henriciella sp.]
MTATLFSKIIRHIAPGEVRAVLFDAEDRACRIFTERWGGNRQLARYGSIHKARVRAFAETQGGAFLELASGEEAFLRLAARRELTEGAQVTVEIASEARADKLARATVTTKPVTEIDAWTLWRAQIPGAETLDVEDDADRVEAAIEQALAPSVTLQDGGQLHIDRTRALNAIDIDTSGRLQKGSAGARALTLNKIAVQEMARQISLRGLGGNVVLDCVGPLNKTASEKIQQTASAAFEAVGLQGVKVLRPSSLGLMESSVPWRACPVEDRLAAIPRETELLSLMRDAAREAKVNPASLFQLVLSKSARQAYLDRRGDVDQALIDHFSGRVTISDELSEMSKVTKR